MIKKSYLAVVLLSACTNVMATGYMGGGFGSVDAGVGGSFDDPTGFELIIGNEVNENLALEASYIDFGESSDGIAPEWRLSSNSLALGALFKTPINNKANIFLKIGLHMWDVELKEDGFGLLAEDDGTDMFFGLGATMKVNNKLNIGARFNSYDMDGDDATMISINALIGF